LPLGLLTVGRLGAPGGWMAGPVLRRGRRTLAFKALAALPAGTDGRTLLGAGGAAGAPPLRVTRHGSTARWSRWGGPRSRPRRMPGGPGSRRLAPSPCRRAPSDAPRADRPPAPRARP